MISDSERNAYYERKRKEIIDRFLGPIQLYPIPNAVETSLKAPIYTNGKSWHDEPRVHKDMNPCAFDPWLHEFNRQMHICNGRIVIVDNTPLEEEVGAPIK